MERRPDSLAASGSGAGALAADTPGDAQRVPIGIAAVDGMLGGGVPPGIIVDVFGGHGTGKTQIMMQAAAQFAARGRSVLFVDTAGTFRPERVLRMAGVAAGREAVLGMISVARVRSVAEQTGVVARLLQSQQQQQQQQQQQPPPPPPPRYGPAAGFDLVVVDSLTDLFSYEYSRYGDLRERNRLFFGYMRNLARLAVHRGVTVMTSNVVRTSGDAEVENMAAEVDMFAHVRVRLSGEESGPAAARATGKTLRGYASCVMLDSACRNGGRRRGGSSGGRASAGSHGLEHDHKENGGAGRGDHGVEFSYGIESGGVATFDRGSDPGGGVSLP